MTFNPVIYLFRPSYIYALFSYWRMVNDPKERTEAEKYIKDRKTIEDSIARVNPYAYLPGLERRLRYVSYNRKYNELRTIGLTGSDLCLAFLSGVMEFYNEAPISAHEGRHAIDQKYFPNELNSTELEFRAKLSEVVFSSDPKLAFCNLISPYLGDSSPHGQADEHIMKIVVTWMENHVDEISGVDKTKPFLTQFDLLTDGQIREILRSVDPLANRK